jgi:hypothetical protein
VLLGLQTERQQVVRFRETRVERDRLPDRFNRLRNLATAVVRNGKLVEDVRSAIVNGKVAAIHLGRALVSPHRDVDVAQ